MQFVNDDMDELFRKAAEDYPLHTKTNDWDKVLEKMKQEESSAANRKKGHAKWLLLLLPLFFICNRFTYVDHDAAVIPNAGGKSAEKRDDGRPQHIMASPNNELAKTGNNRSVGANGDIAGTPIEANTYKANNALTENKYIERKKTRSMPDIAIDDYSSPAATPKPAGDHASAFAIPDVAGADDNSLTKTEISTEPESKETSEEKAPMPPDTPAKQKVSDKTQGKKAKTNINKKGTYAGIIIGPDFSAVRSSKSKGVGYSTGLIAGYNFSNTISLETGIYLDRKRYATNGKNFSIAKFNWPAHTNLLSISGYCDMIEIPLTVRFKQKTGKSAQVFAAAGASSYLMKKEDYQYTTERYGLYYSGNKSYKNSSTHLLPVIHFSAGYERALGRIGNIRIEPYLKLPVDRVGIGNMSLKSKGVYIGMTRSIR